MADNIPLRQNQSHEDVPEPNLLPGEIIVAQAKHVLRFDAMAERKSGMSGVLYVTNFRVTFLTRTPGGNRAVQSAFQTNADLSEGQIYSESQQELHIPLTCIFEVNCTTKSITGTKIKKLVPGLHITAKVEMIEISCKDLRMLRFGLRFTPKQQRKPIVDAILHYAFPSSVSLAFAFSFSRATNKITDGEPNAVPSFRNVSDWVKELSRLNMGEKWRITEVNTDFQTCPTLSALLVCPSSISDADINRMSLLYNDARIPVWCWSDPKTGVPLLYSSAIDVGSSNTDFVEKEESSLFRLLSTIACEADLKGGGVKVIDVSKGCGSVKDLQQAMQKLKELCVLDTTKVYWSHDLHWLSSLDNTRWLSYVRLSILAALDVAQSICNDGRPVILRETSGQDMVIVVGSLAQLILDPYCRTISGFQSLIQRMWVVGGHPFTHRCGHIKGINVDKEEHENQESPVFLHFLDCIFQLTTQFPSAFEFSETYLLGLFDGMLSCMFDTFLFNNECQRKYFINTELKGKPMVSLWDFMTEQLSDSRVASVFRNPLYEFVSSLATNSTDIVSNGVGTEKLKDSYLKVNTCPVAMKFWAGFFLRWLPVVHVSVGLGENPSLHLQQMVLLNELKVLRHRFSLLQREKSPVNGFAFASEELSISEMETSQNSEVDTSLFFNTPTTPFIGSLSLSSYSFFEQSPMTPPTVDDKNTNEQYDTYF